MARRYELRRGDRVAGPFSSDEIRAMAAGGTLRGDDFIRIEGSQDWSRVDSVEQLQTASSGVPDAPPGEGSDSAPAPAHDRHGSHEAVPPSEDEVAGSAGVALTIVGGLFILLGIADFGLYNLEVWDLYAGFGIAGSQIEFFTAIIAGVVGSGFIAAGQKTFAMPAALRWMLASGGMVVLLVIGVMQVDPVRASTGFSSAERLVRGGSLYMCPDHTVGELVDSFVAYPNWESLVADDGDTYVNVSGGIQVMDEPAELLLQFHVQGVEFELHAIEIDGQPWTLIDGASVLSTMCDDYGY